MSNPPAMLQTDSQPSNRPAPVAPAHPSRLSGAWLAVAYVVIASLLLGGLSLAAYETPYFSIDLMVGHSVQRYITPGLTQFMRGVAWPGFPPQVYLGVAAICGLLFFFYSRWAAFSLAVGAGLESLLDLSLKILVNRPRPAPDLIQALDLSVRGGNSGWGLGFPAGHPASFMVLLGFLGDLVFKSWKNPVARAAAWVALATYAILVGISRIYIGDHWFSDVVAGYLLGSIVLMICIALDQWGQAHFDKHDHERNSVS